MQSPTFTMTLVDLPAVKQLDLEYHFPAYTGLAPQKVEGGGDVAALRGTEVRLHIVATMASPSGKILLNENGSAPLTREADGSFTGSFTIDRQGFYRIELEGPHGEHVSGVAAVHDRRDRRSAAVGDHHQAQPRHVGDAGRRSVRRSARQRRLRREGAGPGLLGQRRAGEDGQALRRRQAARRGQRDAHDLSRRARVEARRRRVVLRARHRQRRRAGGQEHDERHLLRADPPVPQGLQAGGVGRRRWRRRRQRGRRALQAAARGGRGDVQHGARSREAVGRQVPRERRVPDARAGQGAAAGRSARAEDEQPARRSGSGVPEDRRSFAEGGGRDEDRRSESAEAGGEGRAAARAARAAAPAGSRTGVRSSGEPAETAAGAAAAAASRWPKIWPTSSSSSSTSSRTSTRCSSAPASRTPTSRSTSSPRSSRSWRGGSRRKPSGSGGWPRPARISRAAEARASARSPTRPSRPRAASSSSRASSRGPSWPTPHGACRRPPTRCAAPRRMDRATAARRPRPPSSG